ncbi:Thioredoxin-like fold [Pseudocohnilembus persalinus]|uniref:Thioredoxin-like fold n=1 Tax=Pseudocohnilembus persalinus TaxID=266149 RepID=A0A0V0R4E4_PSEPJ|nr:Thioredoxin-like fold [Pseudocohnilembus persalinus]|eukprot:KRX09355.1 Thioredoxin-like fold [Pseudocohnilembus persalinus]
MAQLHTVQGNFRSNAILAAAELGGVQVTQQGMAWKDIKSKQNLARNHLGQIPTLETSEGFITQSNAIMVYIAKTATKGNLYGSNDFEAAQVDQWLSFSVSELYAALSSVLCHIWGFKEASEEQIKEATTKYEALLKFLNEGVLAKNQYLVGSGVTIADLQLHSVLVYAFRCVFTQKQREQFANVTAWFERISAVSAVQNQFGVNRYPAQSWI